MNDVLAKPFTRDGMIRILKKHLSWMLKDPLPAGMVGDENPMQSIGAGPPSVTPQYAGMPPMAAMAGAGTQQQQIKFEQTPIPSPTTTSSWHSPGQMTHPSPTLDGSNGGYMSNVGSAAGPGGMVLTPGGTQRPSQQGYPNHVLAQVGVGGPQNMGGQLSPDGLGGLGGAGGGGAGGGGDDRPEKRQRTMYGPPQGAFVQ